MKNITNTPEEQGQQILSRLYHNRWMVKRTGAVHTLYDAHKHKVGSYLTRNELLRAVYRLMR